MSNPGARRPLLLLGLPPLLVALLLVAYATSLYVRSSSGSEALAAGDSSRARQWFAANNTALNLVERWVAPFDEGVAAAAQEDHAAAMSLFDDALQVVPPTEECRVRTNLGLATEARADQLQPGDVDRARVLLQQARAVIAPCVEPDRVDTSPARTVGAPDPPTQAAARAARSALSDDGRTVLVAQDARLVEKLVAVARATGPPTPDPDRPVTGREASFDDLTEQEQQDALDQRNAEGRQSRQRQREVASSRRTSSSSGATGTYNW